MCEEERYSDKLCRIRDKYFDLTPSLGNAYTADETQFETIASCAGYEYNPYNGMRFVDYYKRTSEDGVVTVRVRVGIANNLWIIIFNAEEESPLVSAFACERSGESFTQLENPNSFEVVDAFDSIIKEQV